MTSLVLNNRALFWILLKMIKLLKHVFGSGKIEADQYTNRSF